MAKPRSIQTNWLQILIVVLLVLGVFFRFANLGYKVYWHDEVYTSLRAAGYTREEIDRELFQNRIIPVKKLQKFQRLKPGSTVIDTIRSLGREDPQHPPVYFLMARFWMQLFGSSLTASRSLPALLSLLGLPLMYWLGLELFGSRLVAILATTLLALSPVDAIFVPFLILALPDVLFGGQRSATTRFLIACYPGIHLAIAYLLANKVLVGRWFWRGVTVLLLTGTIASCTLSTFSDTSWSKGISYSNAEVARVINRDRMSVQTQPPLILSDIGDFTNTGDLISLSYLLHKHVQLLLLSKLPNLELLQGYSTSFAFRPSKQLCLALEQKQICLEQAFKESPLWRLQPKGSERSSTNQLLKCS